MLNHGKVCPFFSTSTLAVANGEATLRAECSFVALARKNYLEGDI